mgnify:CR=1 FL=1
MKLLWENEIILLNISTYGKRGAIQRDFTIFVPTEQNFRKSIIIKEEASTNVRGKF